ncbi:MULTISPECIES: DUF1127 domain-containing protein [Rhizobium]|uniref:DUF1127 domain-containing protein n=1 Tax=Rhizobium tropici TaxID=398 RepID=A0A6P1CEG2_RHITR|nr:MULTISPECIES: DUF1127 domain-containing protein [Rhizobium]AGB74808.1 hypothetical protein RTCIAT899_PC05060 [Rhizobium tropici CIAT 899]MBB5593801.1 uncharacterized protein YjiS (DUF1127 family) [Rhizobium tropici]MBB6492499.1 uncharacterized protein YjiS (DUF1127 family) [Rhizobium tropici]NEV14821.1 DUF1127 domain-containing protein [Rhizobium tropici]TGE96428.1 DUF1127 domain-containing protein [Rhizobium sp. SEMIA 4088]
MQATSIITSSAQARAFRQTRRASFSTLLDLVRLLIRKMVERRNRNALLGLSDDQLKDIGLSRGQNGSDVHIYSRY